MWVALEEPHDPVFGIGSVKVTVNTYYKCIEIIYEY